MFKGERRLEFWKKSNIVKKIRELRSSVWEAVAKYYWDLTIFRVLFGHFLTPHSAPHAFWHHARIIDMRKKSWNNKLRTHTYIYFCFYSFLRIFQGYRTSTTSTKGRLLSLPCQIQSVSHKLTKCKLRHSSCRRLVTDTSAFSCILWTISCLQCQSFQRRSKDFNRVDIIYRSILERERETVCEIERERQTERERVR